MRTLKMAPRKTTAATRQTVKVARDLVLKAKKIAVHRGQTQEAYIGPVLTAAADAVEEEIREVGPLAVRDRSDGQDFNGVKIGTFNTTPEIATRLTSLAGQCLTSVAKIVNPHITKIIDDHLAQTHWGRDGPEPPAPADAGDKSSRSFLTGYLHHWAAKSGFEVAVVGDSSTPQLYEGDLIAYSRSHELRPGDLAVVLSEGRPSLRTVQEKVSRAKFPAQLPPPISVEEARATAIGRFEVAVKFPHLTPPR